MRVPTLTGPQLTRFLLLGLPLGLIAGGVIAVFLYSSWQAKALPAGSLVSPSLSR
jgi:uncharacterized protein involved in exopolysaccharide biosynthesis